MLYTNINITDNNNRMFKYVICYDPENTSVTSDNLTYKNDHVGNIDLTYIFNKDVNVARREDYWVDKENIPNPSRVPKISEYKTSKLYVYFPRFSIETYNPDENVIYALTVNTWVGGRQIILGSYIISRFNSFAIPTKKLFGDEYVECTEIDIIDVYDFLYGSRWWYFKHKALGFAGLSTSYSLLNISLHPVVENTTPGEYLMMTGYRGSQNSIRIDGGNRNFLNARINLYDDKNIGKCIKYNLFDSSSTDITNVGELENFIQSTYNYDVEDNSLSVSYNLVMRNSDEIYTSITKSTESIDDDINDMLMSDIGFDDLDLASGWNWWDAYMSSDGRPLVLQGIVTFYGNDENGINHELFYLKTNEIPVTQELFSYFIVQGDRKINLNDINVNVLNINVVQKTEQVVYRYDNVNDAKSNIIQPVFFKARDLGNIVIHPEVTENICINLDQYKSKVGRFIIQIEGCSFHEIGRTTAGVVFKISGNMLPKEKTSGLYYILDENSVLVTNGNYTYVM